MNSKQPKCDNCHAFMKRLHDDNFSIKKDGIEINVLNCKRCGNQVIEFWLEKGFFAPLKRLFKRTVYKVVKKYPSSEYIYQGDKK